jgi:hypothetical protein
MWCGCLAIVTVVPLGPVIVTGKCAVVDVEGVAGDVVPQAVSAMDIAAVAASQM